MLGNACGLGDFARRRAAVVLAGEAGRAVSSSSLRGAPRGRRTEADASAAPRFVPDDRWATSLPPHPMVDSL
ncbi:hypothetical protein I550_2058 [Mycobacterium intracellulare 1956]|uniref:Uncharacterized protein n=1 Tax=Mycobacterium intracellulare 1956 TaxID=1299331 RepID=X8CTX0_MYCIT|nr:hypothetical protein I550_2058 [Mycobacterium intracellulare 1956]